MFYRSCLVLSACVSALVIASVGVEAQDLTGLAGELAASAKVVVAGRVSHVAARWDEGTIYDYVTVQVTDRLKGASTPDTIVLKQLGGRAGSIGLHIEGQASFTTGEEVVLFLAVSPRDGTLRTAQLGRGKWQTLPDLRTGGRRALPPVGPATGLTAADASLGIELGALRAIVASTPMQGLDVVFTPEETLTASPAFTYGDTDGGPPARWHEADDNVAIDVEMQAPPGGLPGGAAEAANAMALWSNGGTRLRLRNAGSAPPACPYTFTGNHRIGVYFNDPCGIVPDDGRFGGGGGYYTTGDMRTINGTNFQAFVQGVAIANNSGPHLASAGCFQDALTHTLGHAIGLGDSTTGGAIMQATLPAGCGGGGGASGLGADDLNGLRTIYAPVASGPNPPAAPTAFTATASLDTVTLTWTPAATGGPAETYIIEAGTGPQLANIVTLQVNAPQTSLTVNGVATGIYYVRVKARNVRGTSGASPEASLNVGNCTAPGQPRSLAAAINDTAVHLTWAAPASGGPVQGYVIAAGSASGLSNILVSQLPATPTALDAIAPYGTYYVRMHAQNSCGIGPATPDIMVRTQPCAGPPNMPTLAFTRTGNQVSFTWTLAPGGPSPTRYWIGAGTASGNYNLFISALPNLTPSYAAAGPSGTYFVRVAAENACGFSTLSNEVQVVIP